MEYEIGAKLWIELDPAETQEFAHALSDAITAFVESRDKVYVGHVAIKEIEADD
jgi:hypothetical protein